MFPPIGKASFGLKNQSQQEENEQGTEAVVDGVLPHFFTESGGRGQDEQGYGYGCATPSPGPLHLLGEVEDSQGVEDDKNDHAECIREHTHAEDGNEGYGPYHAAKGKEITVIEIGIKDVSAFVGGPRPVHRFGAVRVESLLGRTEDVVEDETERGYCEEKEKPRGDGGESGSCHEGPFGVERNFTPRLNGVAQGGSAVRKHELYWFAKIVSTICSRFGVMRSVTGGREESRHAQALIAPR